MTKNFAWVGQSIVATAFAVGVVGVEGAIASNNGNPTTLAEIQALRNQARKNIKERGLPPHFKRSQQEKAFTDSWKKVNPEINDFIGGWSDWEGAISIYPSRTLGKVCMLFRSVEEAKFLTGKVADGVLRLENGSSYIIEQNSLVGFSRDHSRPDIHSPSTLQLLESDYSGMPAFARRISEEVDARAKKEGCQSTEPAAGKLSTETHIKGTIESLPDGEYRYKTLSKATDVVRFKKQGKTISAWHGSITETTACTVSEVQKNSLVRGFSHVIGYGKEETSTTSVIDKPIDLSSFVPITEEDLGKASSSVVRGLLDYHLHGSIFRGCEDEIAALNNRYNQAYSSDAAKIEGNDGTANLSRPSSKSIAVPLPKTAGTARLPTPQDIALLDRTIRDQKPKPKVADRTQVKDLTNNLLKPFVGSWLTADNQKYYVYPSTRTGKGRQACIIVENGSTQDLQIGVAVGNAVGTDMNVGKARMFKTKNEGVLALRTPDSDQLVPLYAGAINAVLTDGNKEAMEQNGCMTSFPKFSAIASVLSPSKTLQAAPKKTSILQSIKSLKDETLALASINIGPDDIKAGAENRKTLLKCNPDMPCIDEKIIIDEYRETTDDKGNKVVKIDLYNKSIAPAILEVYDSSGKIKIERIKIIKGVQPGLKDWEDLLSSTGKGLLEPIQCGSSGWEKCLNQFKTGKYGLEKQEFSVKVDSGDLIRISHSSEIAFAYSSASTIVDAIGMIGPLTKLSDKQKALPLANPKYSAKLKEEILKGFLKDEIAGKYTWKTIGIEFAKESLKKNPLDFVNSSIDVFKSIPDEFLKSAGDGSMEAKAAGDTLDALVTSVGGRASSSVSAAFAVSQTANVYSRWIATQSARQNPRAIVISGFEVEK
jgi:hypothetical protein